MVLWDDIKDDPLEQLKVSPTAMIPHKSRLFRAILEFSFSVRLASRHNVYPVDESSVKTVLSGAIDQLGHALMQVIYAFAQAERDAIFYGKVGHQRWLLATGLLRG